jgi:TPP-dependent pyruvate/acetoin dehydrogenase alpha subunit
VREGRPAFLECEVFRVKPHSLSDPDYRYRPKDAGSEWLRDHDPLIRVREAFPEDDAFDAALAEVEAEVEDAVAFAEAQPVPDVADAWTEVYASPELRGRA